MKKVSTIGIILFAVACGRSEPKNQSSLNEEWNPQNAPENMGVSSLADFATMPTAARLSGDRLPWSGHYWATFQGGTAYRWQFGVNGVDYRNYLYQPFTAAQYENLPSKDANLLSPAEKYDLLTGRTDMPTVVNEMRRTQSAVKSFGKVPTWFGLCHGWAPASYMEPRPKQSVTVKTPYGQDLTFYPSDLKALMTQYYAESQTTAATIGNRCEAGNGPLRLFDWFNLARNSADCRDTNPGSFHLAVVEYIGVRGESFVAEVDRDAEVWNHPVVGYEYKVGRVRRVMPLVAPIAGVSPRAVYVADVVMNLEYAVETMPGSTRETPATKVDQLRYRLEFDRDGKIIGGKWLSNNHPDFLWKLTSHPQGHPTLDYKVLRELFNAAQ